MKAISVFPGKPNSVHLANLNKPSLDEVPDGRGVLVKILRVGVDGTDKDGKAVHWTLQCKFDGKPYKVEGNPNVDTMTYKKVDNHTNKITGTKDDKTVMTGTITVAKDGKSRTVNTTNTGADGKKMTDKAYYDKE